MNTLVVVCAGKTADELVKEWEGRAEFKGQYSVQRFDNADVLGPTPGGNSMASLGEGLTVLVVSASDTVRAALRGSAANKAPGITRDFVVEGQVEGQTDKAPGITRDFLVEE